MRWALAAAGIVMAVAGCTPHHSDDEGEGAPPRVHVQTAAAVRGEITEVVEATGELEALTVVRAASPVAGRVTLLEVRPGDRVNAGDVVARVLPIETEAVLQGLAVVPEGGGAEAASARLRSRAGEIAVRVPFAGVVSDRPRNPGEQVAAGDVLVEVVDPRALAVRADVALADRARVRPGMPATLWMGDVTAPGRVVAHLPMLAPPMLTAPVRIAPTTLEPTPPVHAPVRCAIIVARRHHALLVPRAAIVARASATRGALMRVVDGVARRRRVALGLSDGDRVQIVGGLRPGDVVVTEGGWGLPDGAAVVTGDEKP